MKKLLILAFALAIAAPAIAQKQISAKYDGIVEKYDAATKTLIVKRKDKQGEFVFTDASEVTVNNAKSTVAAIAVGQKVDVEFVMSGATKQVKKAKFSGAAAATATK